MRKQAGFLLTAAALGAMTGCSQGVAATVQNPGAQPAATVSLAPNAEYNSESPVRIPEGRRNPPATQAKASGDDAGQKIIQPVSLDPQERKQEKGNGNRRNGGNGGNGNGGNGNGYNWYGGGTRTEGKQEFRQRTDRSQDAGKQFSKREQPASKSSSQESKETSSTPPVMQVKTESTPAAPSSSGDSAASSATPPPSNVTPGASNSSSTTSSSSSSGSTFPVTYGSASSASSRSYKKPTLPSNGQGWFTENDKDGDGQLTMNEWPSDRFDEFSKYDKNGDGIITLEEAMRTVPKLAATTPPPASTTPPAAAAPAAATSAPAASGSTAAPVAPAPGRTMALNFGGPNGQPMGGGAPGTPLSEDEAKRRVDQLMSFVDSDKNGVLDEKEIENTRSVRNVDWKKYDVNKDGKLDRNELIALYKAEGNNMRGGMGGGGMGGRSPDEMAKVMFDNMDRNKTGKLTKEQFPGLWKERFTELDTNKDGFVDFEEFKAGREKLFQGRGGMGGPGGGPGGGGRGGDGGGRGNRGEGGFGRGGFGGN